jgi:hypothetical protein
MLRARVCKHACICMHKYDVVRKSGYVCVYVHTQRTCGYPHVSRLQHMCTCACMHV